MKSANNERFATAKNIVIINIGALGDNLLATPFIKAVYSSFPGSAITMITSRAGYEVLKTSPYIKLFFIIDYKKSNLKEKFDLIKQIRVINPDIVFNLSEKIWGYIWAFASGAALRVGFTPGASQPFKSMFIAPLINRKALFINNLRRSCPAHEAERYLSLLDPVGIKRKAGALEIYADDKEKITHSGKTVDKITVHLCRKWFKNNWTRNDFIELIKGVSGKFKEFQVIISYGILEKGWANKIIDNIAACHGVSKPYFISDIQEFAKVLGNSRVLLSPDTGIVHLASALGVPSADIFEEKFYRHNSTRWLPLNTKHILIKRKPKKKYKNREEFFNEVYEAVGKLVSRG